MSARPERGNFLDYWTKPARNSKPGEYEKSPLNPLRKIWVKQQIEGKLANGLFAAQVARGIEAFYFVIGDADEIYEFQRANGVEIVEPPEDRPWGLRDYTVKEREGPGALDAPGPGQAHCLGGFLLKAQLADLAHTPERAVSFLAR